MDSTHAPGSPLFPPPEPLEYSEEEQKEIAEHVTWLFQERTRERRTRREEHLRYDQMIRGRVDEFSPRNGPWEGSANLHVQMPYWLWDAVEARLNHIVWSQTPLVVGRWEEDNDKQKMEVAAHQVEWNLGPRRMNMRPIWSRASKIRLAHGHSVTLFYYANVDHIFRTRTPSDVPEDFQWIGTTPVTDEEGNPVPVPTADQWDYKKRKRYQGPVAYPFEWDDVIAPDGCMNYQPNGPDNPGGADYVVMRQYEYLSSALSQAADGSNGNVGRYYEMLSEGRDETWWMNNIPGLPPGVRGDDTDDRKKQQRRIEGESAAAASGGGRKRKNPTMEVLMYWGPWHHPGLNRDTEMLFFVSRKPSIFLGGFMLSDVMYTGRRPLMEMHYQTFSNTINSMGICEIVDKLSEELDTIHNMRVDVGFATNMPWYFVRNTGGTRASQIEIKPLALIPVDDPSAVVPGGAPQNVTSFYHQEETLLLTIIERVMGVADLFLGINVQGGAAARHATGFMGTRQESEARMSNPIAQDVESFSNMAHILNDLEFQYGPEERRFRLHGQAHTVRRRDLYFDGTHDFRLGANIGMYSQQFRHERAMSDYQAFAQNPLVAQDLGRLWYLSADVLRSSGRSQAEIEMILGPRSALPAGDAKSPDQAVKEVIEGHYGPQGFPQPHPADDNQAFIQTIMEVMNSDSYAAMGRPGMQALGNYMMAHQRALMMKMQQQQLQQTQPPQQGGPQGPPQGPGASTEARANAQTSRAPAPEGFQGVYQQQTAPGPQATLPPPPANGR